MTTSTQQDLEDEIDRLKAEVARKNKSEAINRTLYQIAESVSSSSNLDELFKSIHKSLSNIIDTTHFFIAFYDASTNLITFPYKVDIPGAPCEPIKNGTRENSLTVRVIHDQKPLLITAEQLAKTQKTSGTQAYRGKLPKIWLGVPLTTRNNLIGAIAVQSYKQSDLYTDKDVELLEAVAAQVALAIERKRFEVELQQSQERFRIFHDASFNGICIHNGEEILECNQALVEITGFSETELIGMNPFTLISPEWHNWINSKSTTPPYIVRGIKKDGTSYDLQLRGRDIFFQGKTVRVGEFSDITELKSVQRALAHTEQQYKIIFDNSPLGIVYFDQDGTVIDCNEKLAELMGTDRDTLIGFNVPTQSHPEMQNAINTAIGGQVATFEGDYTSKTGNKSSVLHMVFNPITPAHSPSPVIAAIEDISETKRLEEQLQQAQKMESIGRLAGGIAHDFNNMLSVILGRIELIMDSNENWLPFSKDLIEIEKAASRSANLTGQLLAFARKQTIEPQKIDLNVKIEEILSMLKHIIGETVQLSWLPEDNVWPVEIDPSQIDQILTNLCINSKDAMGHNVAANITIKTKNIHVTEKEDLKQPIVHSGDFVQLSISDNGCGISEEIAENIFEPFFTTKEIGKGTGLGLATVFGIAYQNNGFVEFSSKIGEGATFNIYLPKAVSASITEAEKMETTEKEDNRQKTILLVEDEKAILNLTKTILQRMGHIVIAFNSPKEAVNAIKDSDTNIDLILTDVIMPEMNGKVLAETIKEIQPNSKCLFMSGYTDDILEDTGVWDEQVHFIQKPYTRAELGAKLNEIFCKK